MVVHVLGAVGRLLGIDLAVADTTIAMHSMRKIHLLGGTWELLLDPATLCLFAGSLILLAWGCATRLSTTRRRVVQWLLAALVLCAVLFAMVYRREVWCRHLCPLGRLAVAGRDALADPEVDQVLAVGSLVAQAAARFDLRPAQVEPALTLLRERGALVSDAGPVMQLTEPLLALDGLRFMRDPTRGGIASIGHEIVKATGLGVRFEATIPVREPVQSVCDMLGYDPYYLACEGRVVAVVAPGDAEAALDTWQSVPEGLGAARIGRITAAEQRVVLETPLGGERFLEELEDDPLPRIC